MSSSVSAVNTLHVYMHKLLQQQDHYSLREAFLLYQNTNPTSSMSLLTRVKKRSIIKGTSYTLAVRRNKRLLSVLAQ